MTAAAAWKTAATTYEAWCASFAATGEYLGTEAMAAYETYYAATEAAMAETRREMAEEKEAA